MLCISIYFVYALPDFPNGHRAVWITRYNIENMETAGQVRGF